MTGETTGLDERGEVVREHFDAQDNRVAIGFYPRGPLGPMVCFDGGGFLDAGTLRGFANDLLEFAAHLRQPDVGEPQQPIPRHMQPCTCPREVPSDSESRVLDPECARHGSAITRAWDDGDPKVPVADQ